MSGVSAAVAYAAEGLQCCEQAPWHSLGEGVHLQLSSGVIAPDGHTLHRRDTGTNLTRNERSGTILVKPGD